MLLDVLLVANSSNEPDLLVGEGSPALLEHVGVADVEGVEHSVRVDSQHLLSAHKQQLLYSYIIPPLIIHQDHAKVHFLPHLFQYTKVNLSVAPHPLRSPCLFLAPTLLWLPDCLRSLLCFGFQFLRSTCLDSLLLLCLFLLLFLYLLLPHFLLGLRPLQSLLNSAFKFRLQLLLQAEQTDVRQQPSITFAPNPPPFKHGMFQFSVGIFCKSLHFVFPPCEDVIGSEQVSLPALFDNSFPTLADYLQMLGHEIVLLLDCSHFGPEGGKGSGDVSLFRQTLDGLPIGQQFLGEGSVVSVWN